MITKEAINITLHEKGRQKDILGGAIFFILVAHIGGFVNLIEKNISLKVFFIISSFITTIIFIPCSILLIRSSKKYSKRCIKVDASNLYFINFVGFPQKVCLEDIEKVIIKKGKVFLIIKGNFYKISPYFDTKELCFVLSKKNNR